MTWTGALRYALAAVVLGSLSACAGSRAGDNVLRVGLASDLVSLDRAKVSDAISWAVLPNLQENLTEVSPVTHEPMPALAERWSQSADGKEYSFTLRRGVSFHNSKALRAEDVVYSFRRFLNPKTAAPVRQWLGSVESIEAAGEWEVRIRISHADPGFLRAVSVVPGIVPNNWGANGEEDPMGTGPFKFVRWERGKELTLKRFDSYWRGAPKLRGVVFQVIPSENARVLALKSGETDLLLSNSVSLSNAADLTQQGYRVDERPVAGLQYLAGNCSRSPFSSRTFRLAIAHAIDRKSIVEKLFKGRVVPASGPLPTVFAEHAEVRESGYDPEEAKRLMAASGVRFDPDSPLELSYGTEWPWNEQLAQVLEADLKAVGIPVRARKYEWATFVAGLFAKQYQFFTVDLFAGNGAYSLFLGDIFESESPLNFFGYHNREFDAVWGEIMANSGSHQQAALKRAQQMLADDAPSVFLFGAKGGFLTAPRVSNVRLGALQEIILRDAQVR